MEQDDLFKKSDNNSEYIFSEHGFIKVNMILLFP